MVHQEIDVSDLSNRLSSHDSSILTEREKKISEKKCNHNRYLRESRHHQKHYHDFRL